MSEYQIPFHIQEEIMKRLPVKSLIQFRCISKAWKSLIDSSEFVTAHCVHRDTQQQHLLVSYEDPIEAVKYVCFVDDVTFPQQRSVPTLPLSAQQLILPKVVGSSHGLVCFYGYDPNFTTVMVVLWNPSIRKSIAVVVPSKQCIGFGVCPVTRDPKIVSITGSWDVTNTKTSYSCQVMVYTLSTGKWRSLSNNLHTKPIQDPWSLVVTDMFIYWHFGLTHDMIMSFDVTNEIFEVIDLPDSVASDPPMRLSTSKLHESLAILQYTTNICTVWIMEHGVQRSFTKLFAIKTLHELVGFRKSVVPIMQVTDDDVHYKLLVYEPNLEHNNVLEICRSTYWFFINSYMETLLLFDRSDCISY